MNKKKKTDKDNLNLVSSLFKYIMLSYDIFGLVECFALEEKVPFVSNNHKNKLIFRKIAGKRCPGLAVKVFGY